MFLCLLEKGGGNFRIFLKHLEVWKGPLFLNSWMFRNFKIQKSKKAKFQPNTFQYPFVGSFILNIRLSTGEATGKCEKNLRAIDNISPNSSFSQMHLYGWVTMKFWNRWCRHYDMLTQQVDKSKFQTFEQAKRHPHLYQKVRFGLGSVLGRSSDWELRKRLSSEMTIINTKTTVKSIQ